MKAGSLLLRLELHIPFRGRNTGMASLCHMFARAGTWNAWQLGARDSDNLI